MSTVKEVTATVRQLAAHEARIAGGKVDEVRDQLDQAGLRPQAARVQDPCKQKHEWARGVRSVRR